LAYHVGGLQDLRSRDITIQSVANDINGLTITTPHKSDKENFGAVISYTIAYDRRGHGCSTDPGNASDDDPADDLAAVLDLQRATPARHSGAGGEAIRYSARYGPEPVARLFLVGATGPRMMAESQDAAGPIPPAIKTLTKHRSDDLAGWINENIDPFAPGHHERLGHWMSAMVLDLP
jgi:pimeloyl-ACP methyl ester carboxylesterase